VDDPPSISEALSEERYSTGKKRRVRPDDLVVNGRYQLWAKAQGPAFLRPGFGTRDLLVIHEVWAEQKNQVPFWRVLLNLDKVPTNYFAVRCNDLGYVVNPDDNTVIGYFMEEDEDGED
jgi:hypothetical protein